MDPDLWSHEPWRDEQEAMVSFLKERDVLGCDDAKLLRLARSIVYEAAWAKNLRNNKRVRPDRARRHLTNVEVLQKARSIADDLKRMRAALVRNHAAFGLAWVEASPAAQARVAGGKRLTLSDVMDPQGMLVRIDAALTSPDLRGRPRTDDLDRVAIAALIAFEALVGPATATKKEVFDPDDETDMGRMSFSPAHAFLVEISNLLGLTLAGPGDNARLRRVLKQRRAAKQAPFAVSTARAR